MKSIIKDGYEQTSFEIVTAGAGGRYELPVSEAARYKLDDTPSIGQFERILEKQDYTFIAPDEETNYLSSKIFDTKTNEFFHIKINGDILHIFPKDENFSLETFERFIESVIDEITEVELQHDQ